MELAAEQFVYAEVDQVDVDVLVNVFDHEGVLVNRFDQSKRGNEPIQFETKKTGLYRLVIEPVAEDANGSVVIELETAEPVATAPEARLDQLLSQFKGDDTPGAIVAVIRGGEIVYLQAVGMANLRHGIPFRRDTVSNIGSVSKQFTAFAVMSLVDAGLVSLDDNVQKYLPELPEFDEIVTVRHLLNHTNGYREFLNLLGMAGRKIFEGDYIGRHEVLDILGRQPELQDPPGTVFNYNNSAFTLAATLVERVSGQPLAAWLQSNVFQRLDMERSMLRSRLGEIVPNAAEGYVVGDESPFREAVDLGGGGVPSPGLAGSTRRSTILLDGFATTPIRLLATKRSSTR